MAAEHRGRPAEPGFTVDGYRDQLARLHEHIQAHGSFVSHAQRFLIEARKR
jgi:hypothetical protein